MNYWHQSYAVIRLNTIQRANIRAIVEVNVDIIETIEVKRPKWYGHLERMPVKR